MEPDQPTTTVKPARKVLCIEDEHFIGELYARALTQAGYDMKVVVDGMEGLKEAQTNQYDIILLDLMIPNMTGTEILKRLRNPSVTPALKAKIIITTNLEQKEETRQEIESQADGYIIKAEVTPKELAKLLDSIN
jgi:DNA-binding response OmpR family regulator